MICLLALPILAVLGIFSATHRKIAWEAFDCVFRKLTLRKCEARLDLRLKSAITASVMKKSPKAAGWIFKRFEIISWIFVIIMLVSMFYSAQGLYYYIEYGNCNGPDSDAFCIYDPLNTFGNTEGCETCDGELCECENCEGAECQEECNTQNG